MRVAEIPLTGATSETDRLPIPPAPLPPTFPCSSLRECQSSFRHPQNNVECVPDRYGWPFSAHRAMSGLDHALAPSPNKIPILEDVIVDLPPTYYARYFA